MHPTSASGSGPAESDGPVDASSGWRLFEEVGFAACIVDRRLRYRRANDAWRAYLEGDTFSLGHQPISLAGRELLPDLPPDCQERWSIALRAIVDGRLGHHVERTVEKGSLGDRVFVTTASPSVDDAGVVTGALCLRYDVTDAAQASANQERLAEVLTASRRLQHFLGNQLALTLGYVELLTYDPRLPSELRDRVDEALRGVIDATEALSMLRLLTRLELDPDDPAIDKLLGPPGAS
jgi:hypothetical protein